MLDQLRLKVLRQYRPDGQLPAINGHRAANEVRIRVKLIAKNTMGQDENLRVLALRQRAKKRLRPVTCQNPSDADTMRILAASPSATSVESE
jgi:hypothetical protein